MIIGAPSLPMAHWSCCNDTILARGRDALARIRAAAREVFVLNGCVQRTLTVRGFKRTDLKGEETSARED